MKEKYYAPDEGEIIAIQRVGDNEWEMELACCDCGLAHILRFKKVDDVLGVKIFRVEKE